MTLFRLNTTFFVNLAAFLGHIVLQHYSFLMFYSHNTHQHSLAEGSAVYWKQ